MEGRFSASTFSDPSTYNELRSLTSLMTEDLKIPDARWNEMHNLPQEKVEPARPSAIARLVCVGLLLAISVVIATAVTGKSAEALYQTLVIQWRAYQDSRFPVELTNEDMNVIADEALIHAHDVLSAKATYQHDSLRNEANKYNITKIDLYASKSIKRTGNAIMERTVLLPEIIVPIKLGDFEIRGVQDRGELPKGRVSCEAKKLAAKVFLKYPTSQEETFKLKAISKPRIRSVTCSMKNAEDKLFLKPAVRKLEDIFREYVRNFVASRLSAIVQAGLKKQGTVQDFLKKKDFRSNINLTSD